MSLTAGLTAEGSEVTRKQFRNTLLYATALIGAGATPAFAQSAADDSAADAESNEITVTATRRQTTLQDAPINISAIGTETLARQRIDDVKALAAFTPGLTVTQVNKTELSSSKAVQKEIELIRKEWKIKNLKYEVLLFEIDSKAPLYATKDLKTKMALSKIARKINRTVASEGPPSVGGVGRAQKASEH